MRYRPSKALEQANGRRSRSRRNGRFEDVDWILVESLLREAWSPEQTSGQLGKEGLLSISHETIHRHIWEDRARGGELCQHLRCALKKRRKRYAHYDSRGRLAGKRHISERPASVERRQEIGHWEIDTVMGVGNDPCIVTLVERATGVRFYFATPHHAWERGSNENTNGLIRQYLPKRTSMAHVTQHDCNVIAMKLNTRPRKRYDYETPEERLHAA